MKTASSDPAVIFVPDAEHTWPTDKDPRLVTKIVLGKLDKTANLTLPADLATQYENLTHLHLWGLRCETLPALPKKLKCLDVRKCAELKTLPELPSVLEVLVLWDMSLTTLSLAPELPCLWDVSLKRLPQLGASIVNDLLRRSPVLRCLELDEVDQLQRLQLPQWPETLEDLRVSRCKILRSLGTAPWPAGLRRFDASGAEALTSVRPFPAATDYLDLNGTKALQHRIKFPLGTGRPRTLFLHGSGAPYDPALYGASAEENVAPAVRADEEERARGVVPDHEVKIILLGNGRCGKSSLCRRWVEGRFNSQEPSTHGVLLWKKSVFFQPVDETEEAQAELHIWDFAGQDLYHNTHRLFLQSRAIFVICYTEPDLLGYDAASDQAEQERALDDEDVQRDLSYWISMVESLGAVPGLDISPPVIVVRSKANRCQSAVPEGTLSLCAETGAGFDRLEAEVEKAVATLLGKKDSRSVPLRVNALKEDLRKLIHSNDAAHAAATDKRMPAVPPHPMLPLAEFEHLVHSHLAGSDYEAKPALLLERLHRNGFLFYDATHMPEQIVLDQRWATDAIYAWSSRDSAANIREEMLRRKGCFSLSLISRRCWNAAGYTPPQQARLLQFMESCGMCFEFISAEDSASGEKVFLAPGFLPTRETVGAFIPELVNPPAEARRYQFVTEAQMMGVLSAFGKDWGRSAELWRWGLLVRSADSEASAVLDWQRTTANDYTGELVVSLRGLKDDVFEREVRQRLAGPLNLLLRDEPIRANFKAGPVRFETGESAPILDDLRTEAADHASGIQRQPVPTKKQALGITVTFSFAGSDKEHLGIGDVPSVLGSKLAEHFSATPGAKVLCYDRPEGEERLSQFTENLAKGDLTLIFWSQKYWKSVYCCTEMMLVYKAPPEGRLLDQRVAIFVIDGARLSKSGKIRDAEFEKEWVAKSAAREKAAETEADKDQRRKKKLLRRDGIVHDWYEFVDHESDFDAFLRALREYRLGRPLSLPLDAEAKATELFSEVLSRLERPATLIELAMQRLEQGRREDAVSLLAQLQSTSGDGEHNFQLWLENSRHLGIPPALVTAARELLGPGEVS